MKIALVSHRVLPHRGGIETHVHHLSRELVALGHDVTLFTQHVGPTQTWRNADGVEVCACRIRLGDEAYPFAPELWTHLLRRRSEFDIVHAHNYQGIAALAGGLSHRQPFVFTPHFHGTGHTYLARRLHSIYRPFGNALFRRAGQIICVSEAERHALIRKHPVAKSKISVIPNGVAEGLSSVKPAPWVTRTMIVCVGRLEPYKRLDLVIGAMPLLPEVHHLAIIGTGRDHFRLKSIVDHLRLGNRIELLGGLTDESVADVLAHARVVVTASEQEAFGMIVLEARQSGARVVASALAAHQEVAGLDPARAVSLWQPGTGSQGLAEAIRVALGAEDPGQLVSVPRWTDVAIATEEVYGRALATAPSDALISTSSTGSSV